MPGQGQWAHHNVRRESKYYFGQDVCVGFLCKSHNVPNFEHSRQGECEVNSCLSSVSACRNCSIVVFAPASIVKACSNIFANRARSVEARAYLPVAQIINNIIE